MMICLRLQKILIGNVTMISANVININSINSDIAVKIQESINKEENNNFNIKLRKFNRNKIFCRKRPKYKYKNRNNRKYRNKSKIRV